MKKRKKRKEEEAKVKGENKEEKEDGGRKSKSERRVKQCEAGWKGAGTGVEGQKKWRSKRGKNRELEKTEAYLGLFFCDVFKLFKG